MGRGREVTNMSISKNHAVVIHESAHTIALISSEPVRSTVEL